MWFARVFGCLIVIPDLFIIFNIGCDQHFLPAMLFTVLMEVNLSVFKNDLGADLPVTNNTKAGGMVVINIVALIIHRQ
jgi:hypothetical protein